MLRTVTAADTANIVAQLVTTLASTAANRRFTMRVTAAPVRSRHHVEMVGVFVLGLVLNDLALGLLAYAAPDAGSVAELVVLQVSGGLATALRVVLMAAGRAHDRCPAAPWTPMTPPIPPTRTAARRRRPHRRPHRHRAGHGRGSCTSTWISSWPPSRCAGDPELRGRPVVVGGDGDPTRARQVVASASYEARAFGVHAGMPLRLAARKCPDAVFLRSDHPAYEAASTEVMDALRGLGSPVEVWGWDEAYLGAVTADPTALAARIRNAVLEATALSCSVGIGENKLQAKLATGFGKPAGIGMLTSADWPAVMGRQARRRRSGVSVRGRRARSPTGHPHRGRAGRRRAGPADPGLRSERRRRGCRRSAAAAGTPRSTTDRWVARSRSREITYETDLTDRPRMDAEVTAMAAQLTIEVVADGRTVHRVAVTVRTASFFTRSKIRTLPAPTVDPAVVAAAARSVLDAFPLDRPVRLLGVRVELDPPAGARPPAAARSQGW